MELIYLRNVVTLDLDQAKCNGCGMCLNVCAHAVFALSDGKAQIVNRDLCMECGACAINCERMAITTPSGLGCGCATGIIEGYFNGGPECTCTKGC